jgi:type II secretory pathway component GspD/PulD (secretin)
MCRVSVPASLALALLLRSPFAAFGAEPAPPPAPPAAEAVKVPEIADEPKCIDPATIVPAKLAVKATCDFSDSSLREVVEWLQEKHGLVVLLDKSGLGDINVSAADRISDHLADAPIYLLLNRLSLNSMAWYFEDDILHITSKESAESHSITLTYNVGDLLDAGYNLDQLEQLITNTVSSDSWDSVGGDGVVSSLGDVLFVRQNQGIHFEVNALLAALRSHARQTFVFDPIQHLTLREKLKQNVSVNFVDVPLESAIKELAEIAKVDVRLDLQAVRAAGVREREPVTLKLADRKLETVLQAIMLNLKLTWILRDGILWITSHEQDSEAKKIAVYDVRDLCRDGAESDALIAAVTSQAEPDSWDSVGGPGTIEAANPGTLVISHQERVHMRILELLETYRTALRSAQPRKPLADDSKEVTTVYYRLHAKVAEDLVAQLPKLVSPESWKGSTNPQAVGEIFLVSSAPDLSSPAATADAGSETKQQARAAVTERAVLIIRQTRSTHREIEEVIRRVEVGDPRTSGVSGMGMGGMGGGMGGFGGGF